MIAAVAALLVIFEAELLLSIRGHSQTFDESAHLYAGYSYWTRGDFGVNPEHPPLVKLVAALPLLPLRLPAPPLPDIYFRGASAVGGQQFLYAYDADALLFRARVAASIFALLLAVLVFLAGNEMFGAGAALFALALLVFEPNILGNGPLITTDVGASCTLFAAVFAFYRYAKQPTWPRVVICGLATGLALAAKHSALLIFPILGFLALTEILRRRGAEPAVETRSRQAMRLLGSLAAIAAMSIVILWAFYGFRYQARPGEQRLTPPTADFLKTLGHPAEARVIGFLEDHHWLPEAYLYGLTDVANISQEGRPAFLLGHLYATGRWFYFPMALVIKSTLGFLMLLALAIAAREIRRGELRREVFFIAVPPAIWLATAMTSKLDIGLRHILPVLPFLVVLAGAAAWMLIRRSRAWAVVIAVLFVFHAGSSLLAFPHYLPYSNEVWGGIANTHKSLSDSNVGWAGGLRDLEKYLETRRITQCWLAYDGPVNPDYYRIPCTPLPTMFGQIMRRRQDAVPREIQGPVFIGSMVLTGFDWGPEDMNPYRSFADHEPAAVLDGEILEYNGTFSVPGVSALSHYMVANRLFSSGHWDEALAEAREAAGLNPRFVQTHELMASLYASKQQTDEALHEYQAASQAYQALPADFRKFAPEPRNPLVR